MHIRYLQIPLFLLIISFKLTSQKYLFIFQSFRHGTRSPICRDSERAKFKSYSIKEYIDEFGEKWEAPGRLVPLGYRMMYLLGVHNKLRYKNFLDTNIKGNKDISITSTDINRAMLSCKSYLMGLLDYKYITNITTELEYKFSLPNIPMSDELENEIKKIGNLSIPYGINYYPINTMSNYEIDVLHSRSNICPKLQGFRNNLKDYNNLAEKIHKKYGDELFKFFNTDKDKFFSDLRSAFLTLDGYVSAMDNGRKMEKFHKALPNIDLNEFYNISQEMRKFWLYNHTNDINMTPLSLSYTMSKILTWLENNYNLANNLTYKHSPKMAIYSWHDNNIATMELFMNKVFGYDVIIPNFGASLTFELEQDDNDDKKFFINYLVNGVIKGKIEYSVFMEKVRNSIWDETMIKKKCFNNKNIGVKFVIIIVIIVIFITVTNACICIYNYKSMRGFELGQKRGKYKKQFSNLNVISDDGKGGKEMIIQDEA